MTLTLTTTRSSLGIVGTICYRLFIPLFLENAARKQQQRPLNHESSKVSPGRAGTKAP